MFKKKFFILVSFFLGGLFWASVGRAINFSVNWQEWRAQDETTRSTQIYSLTLSSLLTPNMNFGSTFRLSQINQEYFSGTIFAPTAHLSLKNDFFDMHASFADNERSFSGLPDMTNRSWGLSFHSFYKRWVNVRLFTGGGYQFDDQTPHQIDTSSYHWGANINKRWKIFNLSYNYRGSQQKDKVQETKTFSQQHAVRARMSGRWRNFTYGLGQTFVYDKIEWKGQLEGGKALYQIPIFVDWFPSKPANGSNFNDYIASVEDASPEDEAGIIIDLNGEDVDEIRFYYDSVYWQSIPSDIEWDIYWSNDKVSWELIADKVALPYVFSSTFSKGRYLKLIPRTQYSSSLEVNNPEFRLYKYLSSPSYTRENKSYRTNFSVGYLFNPHASLNYNFSYHKNLYGSEESERYLHNISGSWLISKYFQPCLNISRTFSRSEYNEENSIDNISLSIFSQVLRTLSFSSTFNYSLISENNDQKSRNYSVSLGSTAKLYPDLELKLNLIYSDIYNYLNDSKTKNYSSRLNMIARIRPSITLNGVYQYTYDLVSNFASHNLNLSLTWRLSQIFFLKNSETFSFSDTESLSSTYNFSAWWSISRYMQMNLKYSRMETDIHSETLSSFLSWRISKYFSFRTNGSLTKSGEEPFKWAWHFDLTATF